MSVLKTTLAWKTGGGVRVGDEGRLPTAELVTRLSLSDEGREQPREGSENHFERTKAWGTCWRKQCFISVIAFISQQEEIL